MSEGRNVGRDLNKTLISVFFFFLQTKRLFHRVTFAVKVNGALGGPTVTADAPMGLFEGITAATWLGTQAC